MRERFDHIISLGGACATAWQIRHFTGQETAYPFDWMLLPFDSLCTLIENDFEGYLRPETFASAQGDWCVVNRAYDVAFMHEFPAPRDEPDWRASIPRVITKYEFLIRRWRKTLSEGGRILLVRQQGHCDPVDYVFDAPLGEADIDRLKSAIAARSARGTVDHLFVNACEIRTSLPGVHYADVSWNADQVWDNPGFRWRGHTPDWQRALSRVAGPGKGTHENKCFPSHGVILVR